MKHILALALLGASSAFAGPVENMVAQCNAVMVCKECRVADDPNAYPSGFKLIILGSTRYQVPVADYQWIRGAGYAKTASGGWLMCERVREAMAQPQSMRGIAARAAFRADYDGTAYCPPSQQASLWNRVLALFTAK